MLVIGDREAEEGTVSVRTRNGENLGALPQDKVIDFLKQEVNARALERNWESQA